MKRLSLSLLVSVALLALGACDSNAPETAAAPPSADASLFCSAPSISTTTVGNYIHVTGSSSLGGTVEGRTSGGSWYPIKVVGTGGGSVNTTLWPWTGTGTKELVEFRARTLCYDYSARAYTFSGYSTASTFYNAEGP